ncbi:hypothetical protein [Sphaerisporangium corydalis]|uniref:Uncharacterized protein n=1 Tax=Sphaerisporangium corydalis TaxID=1441875 RepID=A0ABV9EHM5_9ACTN|nr:hypothetical protein [Sphaerisporangium corydalis]
MARHDREDPHSLEEQLAWLDAIKETEEAPVQVTVTADETVVSPYPKDPWAMVPADPPAASSPLFRAAGDPLHGSTQPDDTGERDHGDTAEVRPSGDRDPWGTPSEPPAKPAGRDTGPRGGRDTGPLGGRDTGNLGGRDGGAFSAPINAPSEPLSRSGLSSTGGAFGDRAPSAGSGAFGERPPAPGSSAFGERSSGPATGSSAFGERSSGPATGSSAFGERSSGPAASGAFGERSSGSGAFGERPPAPGLGAFGERPASGAGAFGERPASPPQPSSAAPAAQERQGVSEDTDSFTFGSLTEEPPGGTSSGWIPAGPLTSGENARKPPKAAEPPKEPESYERSEPYEEPEPFRQPEAETTGEQPVRGWLEAALPAVETAEPEAPQERFGSFASGGGADTDDVVVPRVEHVLYEPVTEKAAPPAQRRPSPSRSRPPARSIPPPPPTPSAPAPWVRAVLPPPGVPSVPPLRPLRLARRSPPPGPRPGRTTRPRSGKPIRRRPGRAAR